MSYLVAAIVIAVLIYGIVIFNGLVRQRNLVREGWSGIDVQLRRRTDLVPALVETVKGYAAHERKLFEDVAAIRSASIAASNVKTQENAERRTEDRLLPHRLDSFEIITLRTRSRSSRIPVTASGSPERRSRRDPPAS
jgi:hypothetical protein